MSISVLQVYRTYFPDPPGGMQEAIRQSCFAARPFGVVSTIFTLSPAPEPHDLVRPEGRVIRSRSWAAPASCDLGGPDSFRRFNEQVAQNDVVHYWFPWPFADILKLSASGHAKPAVLTYVSDVVRQKALGAAYAPIMWRTLKSMKYIVANCPAYVETSPVLSHPEIRSKVRVIPLGIDELSYPKIGDETIFQRIGLGLDEPYFLFVGVLRYYKGLHTLIQAAKRVKATIVVAGSGPEERKLKSLVAQLAVTNVIFAGQVSDAEKVSLMQFCCGLVLPSHLRSEAYGMVLVEASIFGCPLITCEIGTGTSFVNAHDESGFVVPPENSDALSDAINMILRDRTLAQRLGQGARARYERMFSGRVLGQAYAQLFNDTASD